MYNDNREITTRKEVALPIVCPACRSSSIGTKARTPDESAYWRCEACGEVWNAARRKTEPNGGRRW